MTNRNFSYFEACLKVFLTHYHPLLADDSEFIEKRASESEDVYKELVSEGITCHTAYDVAISILLDGLEFSPYRILYDLICRDFQEIPVNKRRKVAIKLLPDCIHIIKKHPLCELYLTGIISAYLWDEQNDVAEK